MADFPDNQRPEMPDDQQDGGWLTARLARASTGLKMLFFLSLGLLPLGLIAILASAQTARENQQQYAGDLRARLELKAERIDSALSRSMLMLRAAGSAMGPTGWNPALCGKALQEIAQAENLPGRYALHSGGAPRCLTPGYQPRAFRAQPGQRSAVMLDPTARTLRFAVYDQSGAVIGSGELDAQQLATLTDLPGYSSPHQLILSGGGRQLLLSNSYEPTGSQSEIGLDEPIAGGVLQIGMRTGAVPLRSAHILPILLPLLMLLYAGAVGWIIIDRLLVKPLAGMQRAIAAYRPGDKELALPSSRSPAREIGELGQAFERVTQTVARHEAELEAGLDRQTRLVREVHHRVKNNLQVVASLLNLHARGATSEDVSAAYASIQRRVDALAVVHRNHYAELEDNRGVALKSLLSELGANLRANAPRSAANMAVRLAVQPVYVTQDVALSVAFLVTELVEFAMLCGADAAAVTIEEVRPGAALLAIESTALRGEAVCDANLAERSDRIVTGLSRQLRSVMNRDKEIGRYSLEIMVLGRVED